MGRRKNRKQSYNAEDERSYIQRKLVVVGDGECGKTSLLIVFSKDEFPTNYVPTVFETYVSTIEMSNKFVRLALWDTAGEEDYDRLRPLSYPEAHVLLLCYSVNNPDSFENVVEKWLPEILHHCPKVPFLLVATKKDLRDERVAMKELALQDKEVVSTLQGQHLAADIGAAGFFECSALRKEGIQELFRAAAKQALKERKIQHCLNCGLL